MTRPLGIVLSPQTTAGQAMPQCLSQVARALIQNGIKLARHTHIRYISYEHAYIEAKLCKMDGCINISIYQKSKVSLPMQINHPKTVRCISIYLYLPSCLNTSHTY